MNYPNKLKDLQVLCQKNGLKFKGKRKAELIEVLNANSVVVVDTVDDNFENLQVKVLREKCKEYGLSVYGTKGELVRRLNSFKDGNDDAESLPRVQWNTRGRKVPSRPSETVQVEDISTDDEGEEASKYDDLRKNELRQECIARKLPASGTVKVLRKRLEENDALKECIVKNSGTPDKLCESCEENPNKLHETAVAKWFCKECNQHICTLCKEAHEKIKIVRTHLIMPFGTCLSLDNDLTVAGTSVFEFVEAPNPKPQFLDLSASEDEPEEDDNVFVDDLDLASNKRKHVENGEDENDNSFELIYETPYAKIGYKPCKRVRIDVLDPSTAPILTPPPVWVSPTPVRKERVVLFQEVSALESTVTFVEESPARHEISRDMFSESFESIVPETPLIPPSSTLFIPDTPITTNPESPLLLNPANSVPETPPSPPSMPSSCSSNFVPTLPITPARLQGQRWRN